VEKEGKETEEASLCCQLPMNSDYLVDFLLSMQFSNTKVILKIQL